MLSYFQQIRSSKFVTTVNINFFVKKNVSCINLQLPIVLLKKNVVAKKHHCITYTCISIFSKLGLVDQSQSCTHIYLQIIASCLKLQLPIVILKKWTISDMRHCKTSMYINFHQNRVRRSVKTVHTILFAKYCKLHKFLTCN